MTQHHLAFRFFSLRRLRSCSLAAWLFALCVCGCTRSSERDSEAGSQNYRERVSAWRQQLRRDPENISVKIELARAHVGLARLTGDQEQYAEAERLLGEAATGQDRPDPGLLGELASVIMAQHRFAEAMVLAERAVELAPESGWLLAVRGDVALALGQYELAEQDFREYAASEPGYAAWTRLAHVMGLRGQDRETLDLLHRAEREVPEDRGSEPAAWIHLRIGIHHLQYGRFEAAERALRRSLEIAPEYALAREHLAEIFLVKGEPERAEPLLRAAVGAHRDPALLRRLANVVEQLDRTDEAKELREEALLELRSRGDSSLTSIREYTLALLDRGNEEDLEMALQLAERDAANRPDEIGAQFLLARVHRQRGDFAKARAHIEYAMRLGTPNREYFLEAGRIYAALGDAELAERMNMRVEALTAGRPAGSPHREASTG